MKRKKGNSRSKRKWSFTDGADKANMIFNNVFFISITSVLIQGTTLSLIGKWLHLTLPEELKQRTQADIELNDWIKTNLTEIIITDDCSVAGKQIVQIGFPKTSMIAFIQRDNHYITPSGSTTIMKNDKLFVLTENNEILSQVFDCLALKESVQ